MGTEVLEAVGSQSAERVVQPQMECVTPEERLLLRFYRQLDEAEQLFMRRALEAMVSRTVPG
ncbi:hypothetical protein [Stutzerimonas stutzeri]|uniref:hypothetical protein n=1 Tax=Stutzerimonas stutzeri TaxID=316 RepID=UPI00244A1496|nr:hypothetical protein [Stutzerimonas stutzeri]MDH1590522.1 hypothetical protein [Stutzerimonas stutzeri]